MTRFPTHPAAAEVLGPPRARTLRELAAGVAERTEDVVAGLAARLDLTGPDSERPVEPAALDAAAQLEAELLGDNQVRCQHLLLGALRALDAQDALDRAREDFQELRGERAFRAYEALRPITATGVAGRPPVAILLAGIPGTGKSTLAESLARELRAPVFSMDWQLGALVPFGVLRADTMAPIEETMLTASLARQLQLGLDVVIDAVAHVQRLRDRLRSVTESLGGRFIGVECVCSDEAAHRLRVSHRSRGIPGWPSTVTWDHVHSMRSRWQPWPDPHLLLDSSEHDPAAATRVVLEAVEKAG